MSAAEIRLAARPQGWPTADTFSYAEVDTPRAGEGQVLVRNEFMSVDPAMRGWMNPGSSYTTHFRVGEALWGGAVGEVVESHVDGLAVGDHVVHQLGWRTHAVLKPQHVRKVDPDLAPLSTYLGVLGLTGLTAYVGLVRIAAFTEGDTVFVSGAAGAVGSIVGQLAKLRGARKVIGSAGSPEKVAWLRDELGFDAAFDYKQVPVREGLREAAPDGIDVYFDNVGGDHLEAALGALNDFGRIAACGMISQYNNAERVPGPANLTFIVTKRLAMRGFIVIDHYDLADTFRDEVGPLVADGSLRHAETIVDGLANAPTAFLDLLRGANTGKMLVRL